MKEEEKLRFQNGLSKPEAIQSDHRANSRRENSRAMLILTSHPVDFNCPVC